MNQLIPILLKLAHSIDDLRRTIVDWPSMPEELAALLLCSETDMDDATFNENLEAFCAKLALLFRPRKEIKHAASDAKLEALLAKMNSQFAGGGKVRITRGDSHLSSSASRSVDFPAGGQEKDGYVEVPVFYRTDRAVVRDGRSAEDYAGERGSPSYGVARISIPANHKLAELEAPQWWKFEFSDNPKKHVSVLEVDPYGEAAFISNLKASLLGAGESSALIFIHGYNVTFENALRRSAQLAFDLKFPGRALLYSWPSEGKTVRYPVDGANVEWATPHFLHFLHVVMTEVGARTVDVLAHSMGNRALVRALENFDTGCLPAGTAKLRQLIFAAPDVDAGVFKQLSSLISSRAERCTLYASRNDKALLASQILHKYPRAGDAGESLVIEPTIDTVDASRVDTSLISLGHSFFAEKRSILNDIFSLLHEGHPPDKRFDLIGAKHERGPYWIYRV